MGYTTSFDGEFAIDKPLAPEHREYLEAFSNTRRMKRKAKLTAKRDDSVREAAGLAVGDEGGYFVGAGGSCGQESHRDTPDIDDYNEPPKGQPGLWCQWEPNEDGTTIFWDGGEKFYYYVEWITYLIDHFLAPWGYVLNGTVTWDGEEQGDVGKIIVVNNEITEKTGRITYD